MKVRIHVKTKRCTPEILKVFNGRLIMGGPMDNHKKWKHAYSLIKQTPSIYIGEDPWIKEVCPQIVGIDCDGVKEMFNLIGPGIKATEDLARRVEEIYSLHTKYEKGLAIANFIRKYIERELMIVSW